MKTFQEFVKTLNESSDTNEFEELFQKAINDELSATVLYLRASNELDGAEHDYFRQQMAEHANDEFGHFKDLLDIAANRDIKYTVKLTPDALKPINEKVIEFTQTLETNAIEDYKNLVEMTQEMKEFDLNEKFREILADETEHFDDIGLINGDVRKI